MNPITYLRQTWIELKQVRWPSREETTRLTVLVIAISLLMAAYVGSLDFAFTNLLKVIFK